MAHRRTPPRAAAPTESPGGQGKACADEQAPPRRKLLERRQSNTFRLERQPDYQPLPRDRCTLTMLTGPSPGSIRTLEGGELCIGRDPALHWPIEDRGVSSAHTRIVARDGAFFIEDLGSTNGTHVMGHQIRGARRLRDGDRIQLGEHTLIRVSLQDATEQDASRRLYQAAVLDPLTGLYNRGHLEAVLTAEFAFAMRHRSPLSIIFVDLDHFTEVNNTHGHQAGDQVLRHTAQTIRRAIRTEDLAARYGGEEFVLVARAIDLNGALAMAERVRRMIEDAEVTCGTERIRISASFGVASHEAATPYDSMPQLVAAADRALYRAKSSGRNCVCEALDTTPESWRCA